MTHTKAPSAFQGLRPLSKDLAALDADLAALDAAQSRQITMQVRKLRRMIRAFEPAVTMIGQVKAGKTTLVNAMVGWPDLLPADVNPWTSVVTSLHLSTALQPDQRRARFRFFTNEEWDHLIRQGGRVGEMAGRAGAEEELAKVRQQLDDMRAKSQARLGRRFQMLLGQSHDYETFDETLIERYVCMGDDFWEDADGSPEQGRFADITKSADLWFSRPDMPLNLCVQDTPGVNDTFMIREQITINALRGSRLCVMVLSAQQALSSVDLGLIRMISNVKSREVIIFVNRIDELDDPARDVPEIRRSIVETLKRFDGPSDAEIIFGSGFWAMHAVNGSYDQLGVESSGALLAWAEATVDGGVAGLSPEEVVWRLSGLQQLGDAISDRISRDTGAKLIERIAHGLENLRAATAAAAPRQTRATLGQSQLDQTTIMARLNEIERQCSAALEAQLSKSEHSFMTRIEKAHQTFLNRATGSLVQHLEQKGEDEIWHYDPSGLRMLLRSSFQVFVRSAQKEGGAVFQIAANEINALYRSAFGLSEHEMPIQPPPLPSASPPMALGQTIALDLKGSWWTRFWRKRRGYQAFFDDFAALILEETAPMISALKTQNADAYADLLRAEMRDFTSTQRDLLLGHLAPSETTCDDSFLFEATTEPRPEPNLRGERANP